MTLCCKNYLLKAVVFSAAMLSSGFAFCGARGFEAYILNIGDAGFYETEAYVKFKLNLSNDRDKCWSILNVSKPVYGIENLVKLTLVTKKYVDMSPDLWDGKKYAVDEYRRVMKNGDGNNENSGGYDGIYIVKPKYNSVTVMAIGTNSRPNKGQGGISEKVSIELDSDPEKAARQFEQALCKVSKPLTIGFGY